jgi:hypothetical protein
MKKLRNGEGTITVVHDTGGRHLLKVEVTI